ncbi:MAG: pantoate--beta-alanine ligase, partial [Kiritimatiellaeota bacterium]|nr:pantoate--beta-alanine ligase [Kiritimatiellota bacterium]
IAREHADSVAASIFVNPTQFGPNEDFAKYPRDETRDLELLEAAGCDAVFMPSVKTMYPEGACTFAEETALSLRHDGASRPGHFRGVCTVVAKLFNIVEPDIAVFGQKDFQQAAVIKRMVRDLDFPVEIVVAPIVRESDGLAMSSRNTYLTPDERSRATVLSRVLREARNCVAKNSAVPVAECTLRLVKMIGDAGLKTDYVNFADAETLEPVAEARTGNVLLLAAWCGKTRLIDNCVL